MASTFAERTRELEALVGTGRLEGKVGFSPGKIAGPQHLGGWITGPLAGVKIRNYTTPGTGAGYLHDPLLYNHEMYLDQIAKVTLSLGPRHGMEWAMNDLLDVAKRRIPQDTTKLRESGRAVVDG